MKFTFKSFKGEKDSEGSTSPNPQAKRKDQIRRAQKTHRERKEAYNKSLEQEVIQLRANEAKILQETRELYAELTALKKLMAQHGIRIPTTHRLGQYEGAIPSASTSDEEVFNLSIQVTSTKQKRRQICVYKQSDHSDGQESAPSTALQGQAQSVSNDSSMQSPNSFFSPTSSQDLALRSPLDARVSELDLTTVGMDFVLTLESPCLSHITDAPPDAPMGHALMASATLLHHQPHHHHGTLHDHHHQSPSHNHHQNQSQQAWQIPATGIERLLQLSHSISIEDGELTPVQAWDLLRKRPDFGLLEVERLRVLEETLVRSVKCYGFGGVIDRGVFENAMFETFVIGRVF